MRFEVSLKLSLLLLSTFVLTTFTRGSAAQESPNVILVMADDLGWGDLQCFDAESPIRTPELDAMSRNGIRFERFYAASSVCSPTRGACLTGRHPLRYGIRGANDGHLRSSEISLAEVLQARGYRTGHFGKWHLGTLTPDYSGKGEGREPQKNYSTPGMNGFDEWFSTEFAVATWNPYAPENSHLGRKMEYDTRALYWHNGQNISEPLQGCDSEIIMDRALQFIRGAAQQGKPFLSVIWFHAPHAPVVGGPEDRARYADFSKEKQHYYAVVTALDEQVGRLRRTLRELGVADNTMLWFCSDNGPEGNPGADGRSQGSAGPFRGRKRSLYEGGIRVPALLEWPARIKDARITVVPCVTSDYFPTVLDALDIGLAERPYDGISLLPLINGHLDQRPAPIAFQFGSQAALSDNRFKIVHNAGPQKRSRSDNGSAPVVEFELYDLVADPAETTNVSELHPEVLAQMKATLLEWQASCRASAAGRDDAQQ